LDVHETREGHAAQVLHLAALKKLSVPERPTSRFDFDGGFNLSTQQDNFGGRFIRRLIELKTS
jgi:hypothetical protein